MITAENRNRNATAGNPDLAGLKADWAWIEKHIKDPGKNADTEFNAWWQACHDGPWRCTGALGADFNSGMIPNYNMEFGWQSGIKILLGGATGGMVIGYFVPGRSTYSSTLGRNLIRMGYQPAGKGYQAHHIVPKNDLDAARARQILKDFDVGIDSSENGVWLPAGPRVVNWFNDVFHSQTFSDSYVNWVVDQLKGADSLQSVLDTLQGIREVLLSGDTPWNDGPGDGSSGGAGGGTGE